MEWTSAHQTGLDDAGVVHLAGFFRRDRIAPVREGILAELARLKIRAGGKWAPGKLAALPLFQQSGALGAKLKPDPALARLFTGELPELLARAAGARLHPAAPAPQPLLSLPQKEEWSLRALNWHLDVKAPAHGGSPGLQAFVLLDELAPRGGATLALAGSHRLHALGGAHHVLREHPVLGALFDPARAPDVEPGRAYDVHGVPVSVIEMRGAAGDVYVMDLRVLHAPSVNATAKLRMMATNRFLR